MIEDNEHDPTPEPTLTETAREAGSVAQQRAAEMQETLRATVSDATAAAGEKTEAAKDQAADEISRTARGLGAAADELDDAPFQQELLREAADGLKQLAQTVQGKSIGELVGDLEDFGRQNPLGYLGGAALAGFALARFARASAPTEGTSPAPAAWPSAGGGAARPAVSPVTPELTGATNDG